MSVGLSQWNSSLSLTGGVDMSACNADKLTEKHFTEENGAEEEAK